MVDVIAATAPDDALQVEIHSRGQGAMRNECTHAPFTKAPRARPARPVCSRKGCFTRIRFVGSGFTLLELLVVLAILALIAGFAAPQVFKFLGGAKTDAAKSEIKNLSNVIGVYRLDVGRPPPNLEALITKPSDAKKWNGPYLEKRTVPKDPWGNDYVYRVPGEYGDFDLIALGADGAEGGEGENQDINNWE